MGNSESSQQDAPDGPTTYDPSADCVDMSGLEGKYFPKYENLVLEGGGAKACAYTGALEVLEKAGILKNIKRIAGTSGGAIAGTLLALGCSPPEVRERFEPCWEDFQDSRLGLLSYPFNIFNIFGFNPGNQALTVIQTNIKDKMGDPNLTFRQLFDKRGIELCVVAANVTAMAIQYFHPKTTPDVPIAEAVRMSMSIPVLMAPFRRSDHNRESLYVDGGILCNYPIHVFDGWFLSMDPKDSFFRKLRDGRKHWFGEYNEKTLGICVYQTGEIDGMKNRVHHLCTDHRVRRPDTKLARKRGKKSDELLEELERKSALLNAVDIILQNAGNYDKDSSGTMNREEMIDMAKNQSDELLAAHKLVYGDDYNPEEFISQFHEGEEVSFQMFIDYLEEKTGIGLEEITESVDSTEICSLSDYIKAMMNTLQMGVASRYNADYDSSRTIGVYTDYVGTMDLGMEPLDLEFLIRQARVATVEFLTRNGTKRPEDVNQNSQADF